MGAGQRAATRLEFKGKMVNQKAGQSVQKPLAAGCGAPYMKLWPADEGAEIVLHNDASGRAVTAGEGGEGQTLETHQDQEPLAGDPAYAFQHPPCHSPAPDQQTNSPGVPAQSDMHSGCSLLTIICL